MFLAMASTDKLLIDQLEGGKNIALEVNYENVFSLNLHGMNFQVLERQPDTVRSVSTYKVTFYQQRLGLQHGQKYCL
jgi:hypothetical protein